MFGLPAKPAIGGWHIVDLFSVSLPKFIAWLTNSNFYVLAQEGKAIFASRAFANPVNWRPSSLIYTQMKPSCEKTAGE